jgi:hypothetical protein
LKGKNLIAVLGIVVAIGIVVIVFGPEIMPLILKPTPAVIEPTSSPSNGYQPEVIPPPYTPGPTQTATSAPTNTPVPTRTPFILPSIVSTSQLLKLPDLTVTGISQPVCASEFNGTTLRFSIFVQNIGRARTRTFGTFDVDVSFILGQRRYSLDEWETRFNSVVGTSSLQVANLNPDGDIKFTVVVDMKGNKNFGVEVTANSGADPIREVDMTNNTLTKYFSVFCY